MKYIIAICLLLSAPHIGAQIVWQKVSTLPDQPRCGFTSFNIDDKYYIVAGFDTNDLVLSDNWEYNIIRNQWTKKNQFPYQRLGDFSCANLHHGYLFEGYDSAGNQNKTSWKYNSANDTWHQVANTPEGRQQASIFSYGSYIYSCFGVDSIVNPTRSVWRYDTLSNVWQVMNPFPASGRLETSVVVIDSFAYLIGGRDSTSTSLNEAWRYDILHDRWDSLPPIPGYQGSENASVFGFQNFLLVCFGLYDNTSVVDVPQASIHKFDFATRQWSLVSYSGTVSPSGFGGYFQYGSKCYIYGGFKTPYGASLYNDLWVFDATPLGPVYAGVEELAATTADIRLYPNPNSGTFTLETIEQQGASYVIYDMLGQAVQERAITADHQTIDLGTAAEGIYTLSIKGRSGSLRFAVLR